MTPQKDLLEAAQIIDELAKKAVDDNQSNGILLYALARRLRNHAREEPLRDCRSALLKAVRRIRDLQQIVVNAGLPLPGNGRTPTPPPVHAN